MRFRKKPIVIEAVQWTGKEGLLGVFLKDDPGCPADCSGDQPHLHTKSGPLNISNGDWIITDDRGELARIVDSHTFAAAYDPIDKLCIECGHANPVAYGNCEKCFRRFLPTDVPPVEPRAEKELWKKHVEEVIGFLRTALRDNTNKEAIPHLFSTAADLLMRAGMEFWRNKR